MGEVFEAIRTGPGGFRRRVALKRMIGDAAVRGASIQRFLAEARILAQLDHPNVIEVHDVVVAPDGYVIVMDLLRGATLGTLAKAGIPIDDVLAIADQALAGLGHVHAARGEDGRALDLVHRDVTPNNVFVTDAGVVKLLDFGIAKLRDANAAPLTRDGEIHGTFELLAPEVARGEAPDRRTDLYQLGACVYWAIGGQYPHEGATVAEKLASAAKGTPRPIASLRPELAANVVAWIERAMAPRERRFADADEMRAALAPMLPPREQRDAALATRVRARLAIVEAATAAEPAPEPSPSPSPPRSPSPSRSPSQTAATRAETPATRRGSRAPWIAAAIAVAAAAAVAIVMIATRDRATAPARPPITKAPIDAAAAVAAPIDDAATAAPTPGVVAPPGRRAIRGGAATADGGAVFADGVEVTLRRADASTATIPIETGTIPFDVDAIGADVFAVWAFDRDRVRVYHAPLGGKPKSARMTSGGGVVAVAADGSVASASHGLDLRIEAPGVDENKNIAIDAGRGAAVTALAWSPDSRRVAAVVWSATDSAIEIVAVPSLAPDSIARRRFPPGEPRAFGWLDDRRIGYAVNQDGAAVLYALDVASRRETVLATVPDTIVFGGHVGHGAIATIRGTPRRALFVGRLGEPPDRFDTPARSIAGFRPDGSVVVATADGLVAVDDETGAPTPIAGGAPGDIALTMAGGDVIVARPIAGGAHDIVRIADAVATRIAALPSSDLDAASVRCAGDVDGTRCAVGHVDAGALYASPIDLATGSTDRRASAASSAVHHADLALHAAGTIAAVDGRDAISIRGADGKPGPSITVGDGAILERVAWAGSDLIVTGRRWRGNGWVALRVTPAGAVELLVASDNRWLGIPRASATGVVAFVAIDAATELVVFPAP
jgi:serine/threonine-protein kinase